MKQYRVRGGMHTFRPISAVDDEAAVRIFRKRASEHGLPGPGWPSLTLLHHDRPVAYQHHDGSVDPAANPSNLFKSNPPSGWIPATAVKITRKNGRMVIRIRKAAKRKTANPSKRTSKPLFKIGWFISARPGGHVGSVDAVNEKAALRQARKKWGRGTYIAYPDRN
jgi:hypothetical protein